MTIFNLSISIERKTVEVLKGFLKSIEEISQTPNSLWAESVRDPLYTIKRIIAGNYSNVSSHTQSEYDQLSSRIKLIEEKRNN